MISFYVYGAPLAQGSKTIGRSGDKVWLREANAKVLHEWRQRVYEAAVSAMADGPLLTGPIAVRVMFGFARPKMHYGSGRNSNIVKANAPKEKVSAPDVDKLLRALFDPLKNVVWRDDAQVVLVMALKAYVDPPRTLVRIRELPRRVAARA